MSNVLWRNIPGTIGLFKLSSSGEIKKDTSFVSKMKEYYLLKFQSTTIEIGGQQLLVAKGEYSMPALIINKVGEQIVQNAYTLIFSTFRGIDEVFYFNIHYKDGNIHVLQNSENQCMLHYF